MSREGRIVGFDELLSKEQEKQEQIRKKTQQESKKAKNKTYRESHKVEIRAKRKLKAMVKRRGGEVNNDAPNNNIVYIAQYFDEVSRRREERQKNMTEVVGSYIGEMKKIDEKEQENVDWLKVRFDETYGGVPRPAAGTITPDQQKAEDFTMDQLNAVTPSLGAARRIHSTPASAAAAGSRASRNTTPLSLSPLPEAAAKPASTIPTKPEMTLGGIKKQQDGALSLHMSYVDKETGTLTTPVLLANDIMGFKSGTLLYDRLVLVRQDGQLDCLTYTPPTEEVWEKTWFGFSKRRVDTTQQQVGPAMTPATKKVEEGLLTALVEGAQFDSVHSNGTTHLAAAMGNVLYWFKYDTKTKKFTALCKVQTPPSFDIGIDQDNFYLIEYEELPTKNLLKGIRQVALDDLPNDDGFDGGAESIHPVSTLCGGTGGRFEAFDPKNRFGGKYVCGDDLSFLAADSKGRLKLVKKKGNANGDGVGLDGGFNNGEVIDGTSTSALKFVVTAKGNLCYYNRVGYTHEEANEGYCDVFIDELAATPEKKMAKTPSKTKKKDRDYVNNGHGAVVGVKGGGCFVLAELDIEHESDDDDETTEVIKGKKVLVVCHPEDADKKTSQEMKFDWKIFSFEGTSSTIVEMMASPTCAVFLTTSDEADEADGSMASARAQLFGGKTKEGSESDNSDEDN